MRFVMVKMSKIIGIMEHIEPCGIHSGDSNATLPPFNLGDFVMQQIKDHTQKIAIALNTVGLINVQFAIKDDVVYIIEANPRASENGSLYCQSQTTTFCELCRQSDVG